MSNSVVRVRALRNVCSGVERHLVAGEVAAVEAVDAAYLLRISAVELVNDKDIATVEAAWQRQMRVESTRSRAFFRAAR
jgi:hypothetical protein